MKNIDRLLKKNGWTGKELGQLLIASMLNDIRQQGNPNKKGLFTQEDFEKMESSLETEQDYQTYGVYSTLYSAIVDSYNRGQALHQQFYNGFHRLLEKLMIVSRADDARKTLDTVPLIMTPNQYTRLEKEATERLCSFGESYYSLIFNTLDAFITGKLEAPNNVKEAIEATKNIPARGYRLEKEYNLTYSKGYYLLPNGVRSDMVDDEEWNEALKENFLARHKLVINGETASYEETVAEFRRGRILKVYELLFKGLPEVRKYYKECIGKDLPETEEAGLMEALKRLATVIGDVRGNATASQLLPYLGYDESGEWHYYEEAPEDLTLYDLLEVYTAVFYGEFKDIDKTDSLKLLQEDVPDLYTAVASYVEDHIENARGLKPEQYFEEIITWKELAEIGYLHYSDNIKPSDFDILEVMATEDTTANKSKRIRAGMQGIAILKNPRKEQVDVNGDFIDPEPFCFYKDIYDIANNKEEVEDIRSFKEVLVEPALRYCYSFNELLKILAIQYDLPDLTDACIDISLLESKINGYNGTLYIFYNNLYGNEKEQEEKRKLVKAVFEPIELEPLKPTEEAIEAVKKDIIEIGITRLTRRGLKTLDGLIDKLSYYNKKGV